MIQIPMSDSKNPFVNEMRDILREKLPLGMPDDWGWLNRFISFLYADGSYEVVDLQQATDAALEILGIRWEKISESLSGNGYIYDFDDVEEIRRQLSCPALARWRKKYGAMEIAQAELDLLRLAAMQKAGPDTIDSDFSQIYIPQFESIARFFREQLHPEYFDSSVRRKALGYYLFKKLSFDNFEVAARLASFILNAPILECDFRKRKVNLQDWAIVGSEVAELEKKALIPDSICQEWGLGDERWGRKYPFYEA